MLSGSLQCLWSLLGDVTFIIGLFSSGRVDAYDQEKRVLLLYNSHHADVLVSGLCPCAQSARGGLFEVCL